MSVALAQAISRLEQGEALPLPNAPRCRVVGVTGPPGVGKSTLIAALLDQLAASGRRVAVLAVDPSSSITGGALLGDRIRMQRHAANPDVYIRSFASRGQLGGLSPHFEAVVEYVARAGFELLLVETVGVGQNEVSIRGLADEVWVLVNPDTGDEIQAEKAGVLEIADLVLVSKADLPGAAAADRHLHAAGHEQLAVSATSGQGLAVLLARLG